eukprot:Nitzschia sp. Nitz4//scaffold156_size52432//41102//42742//NITZ4_006830-RA/size52432-processed-gene-0.22-mRNA-1//1//CDS//3329537424//681//frame0
MHTAAEFKDKASLQRFPILRKLQKLLQRIPPRVRWILVAIWVGWKVVLALVMLVLLWRSSTTPSIPTYSITSSLPLTGVSATSLQKQPLRLLYIVTTLAEFNTGKRNTIAGQDRLGEVVLPVIIDNIQSMISDPLNFQVDFYLIAAYDMSPAREQQIRQALPDGVGFQLWDQAAPLGYESKHSPDRVIDNTRALARQHRYVIKDKFPYYDCFLAFEDDMRLTGHHVQHYMALSRELDQLREQAPASLPDLPEDLDNYAKTRFHGAMTVGQLERIIPGFVRVEVLPSDKLPPTEDVVPALPAEFHWQTTDGTEKEYHVDPRYCCHVARNTGGDGEDSEPVSATPDSDRLVIWETNVKAFSLRQMPKLQKGDKQVADQQLLDWAVLMMGPGKRLAPENKVGGFWSGREGAFGDESRPSGGVPDLLAQQGGWMLTRSQLFRMHNGVCLDHMLPPFDKPTFSGDGQHSANVEFWSGSYQIFTGVKGGCNMQRIVSLDPEHFSKHLIYHAANNKQRQISHRLVSADTLFGQLHTVQQMATKQKTTPLAVTS